jgi:hypothetical protein
MKLLHFALVSLLLCLPAQAQEIEYGKGLICDTRQQAERLVRHLDGDVGAALRAVNAEEHDPNACAVVTVAFVRGPELATVRSRDATIQPWYPGRVAHRLGLGRLCGGLLREEGGVLAPRSAL